MKKLILISAITIFMIGCGKKVEVTTKEYKQELLKKAYDLKDKKAIMEYKEIREKLEKLMLEGKKEAGQEIDKWNKEEKNIQIENMMKISDETKKSVTKMRETGKLW